MALFTEGDKVIGGIASDASAFLMVDCELHRSLIRGLDATALTGIVIPLEDVLANVIFVVHLTELIIRTDRQGLTLQHSLESLRVELRRLHDDHGDREDGTRSIDGCDMLLDFHLYRRCQPTFMLTVNTVVEPCSTVTGFAAPPAAAKLPPHREQVNYIVARLYLGGEEFLALGTSGQSDEFTSGIHAQRDVPFIFAAAVQQANGKRSTPDYCCLVVSQHGASLPWGARHQRLAVLVEYIHIH